MVVVVVVEVVVVVVVVVVVAVIAVKTQLIFRFVSNKCINNPLNFQFDHYICILVKRNCRISYLWLL